MEKNTSYKRKAENIAQEILYHQHEFVIQTKTSVLDYLFTKNDVYQCIKNMQRLKIYRNYFMRLSVQPYKEFL